MKRSCKIKKYSSRGSAIERNVSKINSKLILLFKKKASAATEKMRSVINLNYFYFINI